MKMPIADIFVDLVVRKFVAYGKEIVEKWEEYGFL